MQSPNKLFCQDGDGVREFTDAEYTQFASDVKSGKLFRQDGNMTCEFTAVEYEQWATDQAAETERATEQRAAETANASARSSAIAKLKKIVGLTDDEIIALRIPNY